MNDKLKTVGALCVAGAVGALVAFGGTAVAMSDNYDNGHADGVLSVEPVAPVVVVNDVSYDLDAVEKLLNDVAESKEASDLSAADLEELQSKYDEKVAELAKLDAYDDVISDEMDKDAAFAEVGLLLEGEDVSDDYDDLLDDLKDDLKVKILTVDNTWDVEDSEDFVYIKLLDNDEVSFSLDRNEDDELNGNFTAEVKSKFHVDGEDGDTHRATVLVTFNVLDGEVVSYNKFLEV